MVAMGQRFFCSSRLAGGAPFFWRVVTGWWQEVDTSIFYFQRGGRGWPVAEGGGSTIFFVLPVWWQGVGGAGAGQGRWQGGGHQLFVLPR